MIQKQNLSEKSILTIAYIALAKDAGDDSVTFGPILARPRAQRTKETVAAQPRGPRAAHGAG